MARYDVVRQGRSPGQRGRELHISASSPGEAVVRARRMFDVTGPPGPNLYAVYRHRRVRGRKLVGVFGSPDSGGGTAGVREPRRPRPDLPSLSAERDLPD